MPRERRSGGTATRPPEDDEDPYGRPERGGPYSEGGQQDASPDEQAAYDAAGGEQGAFDRAVEGTIVGNWLGANARAELKRAQQREAARQAEWDRLEESAPGVDALTSRYQDEGRADAYGDLLGGPSRLEGMEQTNQQAALDAMGGLMAGGLTDADKAAIHAQRLQSGQRLGAANEAAIQQMSARGMAGGGQELAARMGGADQMAQANAMGDASTLGRASDRAFAAMQGYGQLSGQMYGQDMQRRAQLDAWNQQGLDWRRGRNTRNTDTRNRGEDSRARAEQQAYENRYGSTAGRTNYSNANQDRQFEENREDEAADSVAGLIGSILE